MFFPSRLSCLLLFASVAACSRATPPASSPPADWFVDRASQAGLTFTHFNGMSGHYYYPEIMAPGVALLDYDNDGDLDVYVTQGQPLGSDPAMLEQAKKRGPLKDRLFRNDGGLHFTDVTEESRIDLQTYGMGVAVGDFNNDGFVDIYRTSLNGATLLRNNGNGTFTDVTKESGAGDPGGWGVSATFFDYDRDGSLDLFVGNYLRYSLAGDVQCESVTGRRDYCPPGSYRAQPSRLYHNRGDGTFEDVTAKALAGGAYGPALGVSTADFNNDGWIDLYVANDSQPNQLWINQHDGTFKDTAFLAGAAVSGTGQAEASMGVDAGDIDNDGDEDLIVTNWLDQMNALYVNDGAGNFEDRRALSGLGAPSLAKTGFGAGWLDFDRDGWLDLFVANGGVATIEALARAKDPFPLKMTPQLYRNLGGGRFEDVSARAGAVFRIADVGRGAAFGDIDNDGNTDIVVANDNGPLRLFVNNSSNKNHWVGLRLVGTVGRAFPPSPRLRRTAEALAEAGQARRGGDPERVAPRDRVMRDQVGARVQIVRAGAPTLWRRIRADGSYASSNDSRVLAGLGQSSAAPRVVVMWPGGPVETFANVAVDRYTTLVEGSGTK
jgi:enediyne biosynthesis protein E4